MIQRSFRYYYLRVTRQRGTPENIALGMAIGVFIGLLIPVGQIVVAVLGATILKANRVTAFIGTWISNPATFMIIIPFYLAVGQKITGIRLRDYVKLKDKTIVAEKIDEQFTLGMESKEPEEVEKSWLDKVITFCERVAKFIGRNGASATIRLMAVWLAAALPFSIIGSITSYHVTRMLVEGFRRKQSIRRIKKRVVREQKAAEEEALRGVHTGLDDN